MLLHSTFFNGDLILRKIVYPYEYLNNWQKFEDTSLPNRTSFYSNVNIKGIEKCDYKHDYCTEMTVPEEDKVEINRKNYYITQFHYQHASNYR